MFKPLTLEELKSIVNIQISSLQKRLLEQNIELELSDDAKIICKRGL